MENDGDRRSVGITVPLPKPVARPLEPYHQPRDHRDVGLIDNRTGKGDHKQLGAVETAYAFTTPAALLADFWHDVD
jgi:hypothetical protein